MKRIKGMLTPEYHFLSLPSALAVDSPSARFPDFAAQRTCPITVQESPVGVWLVCPMGQAINQT